MMVAAVSVDNVLVIKPAKRVNVPVFHLVRTFLATESTKTVTVQT